MWRASSACMCMHVRSDTNLKVTGTESHTTQDLRKEKGVHEEKQGEEKMTWNKKRRRGKRTGCSDTPIGKQHPRELRRGFNISIN